MEREIDPILTRIAEGLQSLGYSPTDALVFSCFLLHPTDLTSQQVERITWLRQPQVSLSINSLIDKKVVKRSSTISKPIGRSITTYELNGTPDKICDRLEDSIFNEIDLKMRITARLKVLIHDVGNEEVPGNIQDNSS